VSIHLLRLAAALIPAALALHEGVYALSGGGFGNVHSYYAVALPVAVTAAAAVALAALLLPLLVGGDRDSRRLAPLAAAGGLALIFAAQELSEALLVGGGSATLGAALASAWLLPPLALLLGALVVAAVDWLGRAGELLLALSRRAGGARRDRDRAGGTGPRSPSFPAISPLAFGLARRPPPSRLLGT
jgi:hypothetical protein